LAAARRAFSYSTARVIIRHTHGASRIKFASTRLQGTPEENKGVSSGSLAHFGTYSADAAGTTLTFHVERSSFPNWDDTDQKWSIIKLAGDDLTLGVARTSSGGKAELVWKRAESTQ